MRHFYALALAALVGCAAPGAAAQQSASPDTTADNPRLAELFRADQAEREDDNADWSLVERHDADRRREVQQALDTGGVRTAADHYHAAMVFQHGSDSTAFRKAHELAREAERLGDTRARWLAAASLDRYLVSTERPQRYGTQFQVVDDVYYLAPMDTLAVSDAERTRVGARTMAQTRAYLAAQNGTATGSLEPPPPRPVHEPTVNLVGTVEELARGIVYTDEARAAGTSGAVILQLTVLSDGTVGDVFVVEGLGHGLDEEAVRVMRGARFVNHVGAPWEIRFRLPFAP